MPQENKGPARIVIPARDKPSETVAPVVSTVSPEPAPAHTSEQLIARMRPAPRDPWVVPLAGLVLAFSAISLIVQCLVAFS